MPFEKNKFSAHHMLPPCTSSSPSVDRTLDRRTEPSASPFAASAWSPYRMNESTPTSHPTPSSYSRWAVSLVTKEKINSKELRPL